jgi:hypothetical protein
LFAIRVSTHCLRSASDSHRAGQRSDRFSCGAKHVGRWDGDTLVIETTNLNGYIKVDTIGHPLSNQARLTQTFKRVDFGHIEHTFTVNDPKTYTKPWTVSNRWTIKRGDDRVMEYSCEENNEGLYDGTIVRWKVPRD